MASSSSTVDEDEVAMQIRLLQLAVDIRADGVAQTEAMEGRRIKAASDSKTSVAMREIVIEDINSMKDGYAKFKCVDFEIQNDFFKWFEDQQKTSMPNNPLMCLHINYLLPFDTQRIGESSFLKLLWRHSNGILDDDLLLFLSKLAEYYAPSHEVVNLEEFILTNEERAKFLNDCSTLDNASRLAKDFNEFSLHPIQGQKSEYWTQRDHKLHLASSFSESVKPSEVIFPFANQFEIAKECLDHLDVLKNITMDLNPNEFDTIASVQSSFKSPELQALHALKKEMQLHAEVALQLEQLSGKHLLAYEELKKNQLPRLDEFFRTCHEEKKNVVQEALYKKAKCLASIKKIGINRQLSSGDLLKGIVQKAGSAFEEVEGKLKKAQSSEELWSKECTLCYSEFSKKRKRACLDPCGHASACIDCATKAWARKPCCPWCKAHIQKPISIPAQIFL